MPATEQTELHERTRETRRCSLCKVVIENGARGAACGVHARSGPAGRELRASAAPRLRPADACGIEPYNKPAAERMGLLSSGARMQPSAQGQLRAAGRCRDRLLPQNTSATTGDCGLPTSPTSNLPAKHLGDNRPLQAVLTDRYNAANGRSLRDRFPPKAFRATD